MYLSYQKLSDMGEKLSSDFNYYFFGRSFDRKRDYFLPMMNERQANILASAIMMPRREINFAMQKYAGGRKLVSHDGWFGIGDYKIICKLTENLGVSKKALAIRLNNLGYVRDDYIKEAAA